MKSDRIAALQVKLHGRRIGVINRIAGDRYLFAFEQDYIEDAQRPTLSLSFKGSDGGLVDAYSPTRLRLPPFFSNLLPEGPLRAYLAQRAGVKAEREFFLLAALGADLPGAVTVMPVGGDALEQEVEPIRPGKAGAMKFSLAGVQLKFSAIMEASGGLTVPASGDGGSWIVKLPSARFAAVPENEHTMLALAAKVGIAVPVHRLVDIGSIAGLPEQAREVGGQIGNKALAVQRFDRAADGTRIHMEDFAQVFGVFPEAKYQRASYATIAAVLAAETAGTDEFLRRLVFSVTIGNADMHLKNWSLLYRDGRTPSLSPAYDMVATIAYLPQDSLALTFGGSRSLEEITPDQLRRFADTARIAQSTLPRLVEDTIARTVAGWKTLDEKDLLSRAMRDAIAKQIERVASNTAKVLR